MYFDLFGGTDGPPELLVTPLARVDRPGRSFRWLLNKEGDSEVRLNVGNLELAVPNRSVDAGAFDFLLHYLTARGGIPQSILKLAPGMPKPLTSAMSKAGTITSNPPGNGLKLTPDFESTPSCSDSQYP